MAKFIANFPFIGSLRDVSVYKMSRSGKLIMRRKGGNSKERIKTVAEFATARKVNADSWCAGQILLTLCKGFPKVVTYCVQFVFERTKYEGMVNLR